MFDARLLRENPDLLRQGLAAKKSNVDVDQLIALDRQRRELTQQIDQFNTERNTRSKDIGARIKAGEDPAAAKEEVRVLGEKITAAQQQAREAEEQFEALALTVPNLPHNSTPVGTSEADNQVVKTWGEAPKFEFTPKPHWELGETLGILDLARGVKISGSGFFVLRGAGAKLERALINWFIDVHVSEFGYTEIWPPHLVNSDTMRGTGQLPKMADDMYRIEGEDLWSIPTAEVPVTNLYRDEILDGARLPIYHCAWTPCFRKEAGSYGKEVRGITRVHQFDKVEMVKFVKPETSYDEHEALTRQAEILLERLGLHYRRVLLCSGDISFAAAKCYDLEVWAPGMDRWLEVSSCSNFEDFQARRSAIRYRPDAKAKPQLIHTLNGSGLALPRTVIAILETYQQPDGTITVPEVLRGFMGMDVIK